MDRNGFWVLGSLLAWVCGTLLTTSIGFAYWFGAIGFFLLGVLCFFDFCRGLAKTTPKKFEQMLTKVIKVSLGGWITFQTKDYIFERHVSQLPSGVVYRIKKGDQFFAQVGVIPATKAIFFAHTWEKKI